MFGVGHKSSLFTSRSFVARKPRFASWRLALLLGVTGAGATLLSGCGGGSGGTLSSPAPSLVTTLAGTGSGFSNPVNVDIAPSGDAYVCDFDNNRIARVTDGGVVTNTFLADNFVRPFGITFTPNGTLYVTTDGNDLGDRDNTTGTLWRINVNSRTAGVVARNLGRPRGIVALNNNEIVLCDVAQHDVRIINLTSGAVTPLAGARGTAGFADGSGTAALFDRPYGPTLLPDGSILLADQNNNRLRRVTRGGAVTTWAGDGTAGLVNGPRLAARFNRPQDVAADAAGNVYVTDVENHVIRKVDRDGNVSTLAGSGTKGFKDGNFKQAQFYGQEGLALSRDGLSLLVADGNGGDGSNFNRLRRLVMN